VEDVDTTVLVPLAWTATVDEYDDLRIDQNTEDA
jgi:hypothetical protein